jgi:hypothetical protein
MNWASDRVKRIKKILKEMKLIEVVQKRKYYYVHLFLSTTRRRLARFLGTVMRTKRVRKQRI